MQYLRKNLNEVILMESGGGFGEMVVVKDVRENKEGDFWLTRSLSWWGRRDDGQSWSWRCFGRVFQVDQEWWQQLKLGRKGKERPHLLVVFILIIKLSSLGIIKFSSWYFQQGRDKLTNMNKKGAGRETKWMEVWSTCSFVEWCLFKKSWISHL